MAAHIAGDADDEGASQRLADAAQEQPAVSQPNAALVDATPAPYLDAPAPDSGAAPAPISEPPTSESLQEAISQQTQAVPAPLARRQRMLRGLVSLAATLICVVALAPPVVALLAALAAFITEVVAVVNVVILFRQGAFLQMADAMNALSVASRVGFLAVGYLGLFCALMALLSGMLGRGRGRLFMIPGALLTASALVLFATSLALCWPLVAPLAALALPYRIGLAIIGAYVLLDTVTLATVLADTRQTRRRAPARRRASRDPRARNPRSTAAAARGDAPPTPPPTLASSV